jgi:hypothetical protein
MYWTHDVSAAIVRGTLDGCARRLTAELLQVGCSCVTRVFSGGGRSSM